MELKHGYTLRDLQQMTHAAVMADRSMALDYRTRTDVAWSSIATALYEADEPPHRQSLIRTGWQAIYREARDTYRQRGYTDDHAALEVRSRFVMFWGSQTVPSHEDGIVERLAVYEVLSRLTPTYLDAIIALAAHGNYQDAAASMGLKQGAFNFRVAEARRRLVRLWLEHETPRPLRIDRRVEVAGKALSTHCGKGHEYTPENTRWRKNSGRRGMVRDCRACDTERSRRRTQQAKASRGEAA